MILSSVLKTVVDSLWTVGYILYVSAVPWRCSSNTSIPLWFSTPVIPLPHCMLTDTGGAAGMGIQVNGEGGKRVGL